MELTRRDALAALAGLGIVGGGGAAVGSRRLRDAAGNDPSRQHVLDTLVAAAEVVFPSEVSGIEGFVSTFSGGRYDARPDHATGLRGAVADLDDASVAWHDAPFADLDPETRDSMLRELGVDTAEEHPEGTTAERVRFFVVNEVLYGLFTSPNGGELTGTENPIGHPGGTESYQRGPR
jgi:hypothetical protein